MTTRRAFKTAFIVFLRTTEVNRDITEFSLTFVVLQPLRHMLLRAGNPSGEKGVKRGACLSIVGASPACLQRVAPLSGRIKRFCFLLPLEAKGT
jgi:hypothetical protein